LYPNEIYFQVREVDGFEDGIYHFEIASSSVTLLHALYDEGVESFLKLQKPIKGFVFFLSAVYFRSSWKYKDRAFRYCLLDGGHILGQVESSSYLKDFASRHIYDFDKLSLNKIFGFGDREFFISTSVVGVPMKDKLVKPLTLALPYVDATGSFSENKMVEKAYRESININDKKPNNRPSKFNFRKDVFKESILKRRSIRGMNKEAISKDAFSFILDILNQPIMSDVDEEVEVYIIVNRVLDMPLGVYKDGKYIKHGDFSRKAGYLCLEQYHLGENSAFTIFLTSQSKNYQAMYQKAGILGNRLYLASTYMQIGCSGIGAYYDDEVVEFLELEKDTMVLYGICVGN